MPATKTAEIAVIGGSGLYSLFGQDDGHDLQVTTPFGVTVTVTVGHIGARPVAFVPRHGTDHSVPPHRIDARAAVWAVPQRCARAKNPS